MADGYIQVQPDSTGKKLDTDEQVRPSDGATVERERIVLARPSDASASMRAEVHSPSSVGVLKTIAGSLTSIGRTLRETTLRPSVRRFTDGVRGGFSSLRMTGLESLATAQAELPFAEIARSGRAFLLSNQIGSNTNSSTTALSTTTPGLQIVNFAPPGGPTAFIKTAIMTCSVSVSGLQLMGTLSSQPFPPGTFTIGNYANGYNSWSNLSGSGRAPFCRINTQSVAFPFPPGTTNGLFWFALTPQATATASSTVQHWDGFIAIPPRHALGLAMWSSTSQSGANFSILLAEHQADME